MSNSLVESSLLTIMEKEQEVMVETSEVENTEAAPAVEEVAPKRVSNASVPVDQFDWDSFEEGTSEADRKADEEMYNQTLSKVVENEVVEGTVMAIGKREVLVNIGYKSEGVINISEFRYNPDLKVGDKVEVYVETAEDKKGQLILSHRKAHSLRSWDLVNEAYEKDEIVKGYVKCRTKGGMIVDVFGIEAFLPGSQIDVKPIRDYDVYVNKTMDFKIVKINNEYRNVNITSYGVFVDLGGVDGLIHITDLSWGRINHPEEVVQLDQKINVVILDFDDTKKRIALGLKQLQPHPWDALDPDLKVGDKVKGKVVVIADYGAFVEIQPGVEGLIHVSEMSWSLHLRSAQDFLKVGDEVEAVILTLDREERKMSLGIKQLKEDPWATITEKYPVNSRHTATVRNFTNFGVFVELEEGVDGLVHISDLSWTKKIKHPSEFTSIGDKLEVVVLEVDKENRRLSLGHKQLEENPWDVFETQYPLGSIHEGTVASFADKGAVISLGEGVEGTCSIKNLQKQDGTTANVGEKLAFKVVEFNKSNKKIVLSHTKTWEEPKKEESRRESDSTQSAMKKLKTNLEKTTLGDIAQLADLKSKMEKEAK